MAEFKHGMKKHKLYGVWVCMKQRCNNPKSAKYKYYGARGIFVCNEWSENFLVFYNWAMANGYKEGLSLDRIDTNGNYEPLNCRWVSQKLQCNNSRRNHLITINGKTMNISQWGEESGISPKLIWNRLFCYGWTPEESIGPTRRNRSA